MLLVNRPFGLVYQCQHTLNQQFDNVQLRHGDKAFTQVNAQSPRWGGCVNALINKGFEQSGA